MSHRKITCASVQCSDQLQVPAGLQAAALSGSGPKIRGNQSALQMVIKKTRLAS